MFNQVRLMAIETIQSGRMCQKRAHTSLNVPHFNAQWIIKNHDVTAATWVHHISNCSLRCKAQFNNSFIVVLLMLMKPSSRNLSLTIRHNISIHNLFIISASNRNHLIFQRIYIYRSNLFWLIRKYSSQSWTPNWTERCSELPIENADLSSD